MNNMEKNTNKLKGHLVFNGPVTNLGNKAFYNCTSLKSIILPKTIIDVYEDEYGLSNIFYNCKNLETIKVAPNNSYYDSRENCNAIIETATNKLIFGSNNTFVPDSVTEITDTAFGHCTNKTTKDHLIYFKDCLIDVNFPGSTTRSLKYIKIKQGTTRILTPNLFLYCREVKEIYIPDTVTAILDNTFAYCYVVKDKFTNLSKLDSELNNYWGAHIVDVETDDGLLIKGDELIKCREDTTTTNIIVPNTIKTIKESAFSYLQNVVSITISEGVQDIQNSNFYSCNSLTKVVLPSTILTIDTFAFLSCDNLTTLVCHAVTPPVISSQASFSAIEVVYVPAESVEMYKTAETWKKVANLIQPIPES